jgi:hypothetical protein
MAKGDIAGLIVSQYEPHVAGPPARRKNCLSQLTLVKKCARSGFAAGGFRIGGFRLDTVESLF